MAHRVSHVMTAVTGGRAWLGPLFAVLIWAGPALAQSRPDTLFPLPEIEGALSWDVLAEVEIAIADDRVVLNYGADVLALDGETIKMVGFLLPLGGPRQLLSKNSPNCPFCVPTGPEGYVELVTAEPIDFSTEAVVVNGTLNVLKDISEGYYYRMTDVEQLDE